MKKAYITPEMEMVVLQQQSSLLAGSGITGITSNSGIDLNIEPGTGTGVSQPRAFRAASAQRVCVVPRQRHKAHAAHVRGRKVVVRDLLRALDCEDRGAFAPCPCALDIVRRQAQREAVCRVGGKRVHRVKLGFIPFLRAIKAPARVVENRENLRIMRKGGGLFQADVKVVVGKLGAGIRDARERIAVRVKIAGNCQHSIAPFLQIKRHCVSNVCARG